MYYGGHDQLFDCSGGGKEWKPTQLEISLSWEIAKLVGWHSAFRGEHFSGDMGKFHKPG